MERKTGIDLFCPAFAAFGLPVLQDALVRWREVTPIPYSELRSLSKKNRIGEAAIAADTVRGELRGPRWGKSRRNQGVYQA